MTIKNRKGQVAGAEEVPVPVKKRGRPKKTEVVKNKIKPCPSNRSISSNVPSYAKIC